MTTPDSPAFPLDIRLFGPFDVQVNSRPLRRLRTRKGQWLLALLVLRNEHPTQREWMAGTLWPESTQNQAAANLRLSLTDLRQALGEQAGRLHSPTLHTLRLDLHGARADVLAFDAAIAARDSASLERAVELYRGPLLADCPEEWVLQEREAREQAYLSALEALARVATEQEDLGSALRYLR